MRQGGRHAAVAAALLVLLAAFTTGICSPAQSGHTISVREARFGAKGDGATDDTAARPL